MRSECRSVVAVLLGGWLPLLACSPSSPPGPADCAGVAGGTAQLDSCERCVGGTTGRLPCAQDCAGVWGGLATSDHCGQCVGGTTGNVACAADCAGVWGGDASEDSCGACVGGNTGRVACVQDCAGVWGGQAAIDHCGACAGGTTGRIACAQDCAGTWGGTAARDNCGACVGGTTGNVACAQDCAGTWGGTAALDHCGACVGGTTGRAACTQDCAGTWGGTATRDDCGACVGGTTGRVACTQDCAGTWGGTATRDNCGACVGGTTGRVACTQDCAGTWGGTAALDHCGACVGGTTGRVACVQDCADVWGGTATRDHCGQCVGGTTGNVACTQDCAGVWGGTAQSDPCNRCTGGTTARTACSDGVCRLGPGETVQGLVDNPACAVVELPAGTFRGPVTVDVARMGGKTAVEVRGAARDATVFEAGSVFSVKPDSSLRVTRLTMAGLAGWVGGAIRNEGTASLEDVAVTDNTAWDQAVIVNMGQMEIRGSTITGNVNKATDAALGGAVYNSGTLRVVGTTIAGNSALGAWQDYGAGICNDGGTVTLEDSEVASNLARATVNTGGSLEGGGIFSYQGRVDVTRTRIHHNRIEHPGYGAHGGGISAWGGVVTLSPGSEVSFNEIVADDEVYGAGIYVEQRTQLAMDGVTVEGNAGQARTYLGGAAVMAMQASLDLRASTLANNRLEALPGLVGTGGAQILGGVVYLREGILTVTGGRIAGNTMVNGGIQGGLVRVDEYASPSEVDEAIRLDGVEIAWNAITTVDDMDGGLVWAVRNLRVKDCDIHSNTVRSTAQYGPYGGLVHYREAVNLPGPGTGELVVEGTRVADNTVEASGGATGGLFYVAVQRTGPVVPTVTTSSFVGNTVSAARGSILGGLLYLDEARHVRISESAFRANAIAVGGPPPIGSAPVIDGGLFYHTCTMGFSSDPDPDGEVVLARTDVSQNQIGSALAPEIVRGGVATLAAPWHADGHLFTYAATNATFSQNVVRAASAVDGAMVNVFNKAGADVLIALDNVTLALNQADGPLGSVFDFRGQATEYRPATIQLRNTIVAQNSAPSPADCPLVGPLSQTLSWGYDLLGDVTACPGLTPAPTDLVGVDPLFGAYGDNGGVVTSLAILPGSPAVDGGDPAGCVDLNGNALATDQRGLPRPSGSRCDVGAFEFQAP